MLAKKTSSKTIKMPLCRSCGGDVSLSWTLWSLIWCDFQGTCASQMTVASSYDDVQCAQHIAFNTTFTRKAKRGIEYKHTFKDMDRLLLRLTPFTYAWCCNCPIYIYINRIFRSAFACPFFSGSGTTKLVQLRTIDDKFITVFFTDKKLTMLLLT